MHFDSSSPTAISLYVYCCALVLAVGLECYRRGRADLKILSRHAALSDVFRQSSWFSRFIIFSYTCRSFWCFARAAALFGEKCEYHCMYSLVSLSNRLASVAFFAAFSFVITAWAGIAGAEQSDSVRRQKLRRTRRLFFALNLWLLLCMTGLMVVRFLVRFRPEQSARLEDADAWIVALLSAVVALGVGYYGLKLFCMSGRYDTSSALYRARARLMFATLAIPALCLARATLFLYRPVTGREITGWVIDLLYPWFWYSVPEIVSGVTVLLVMWPAESQPESALLMPGRQGVGDLGDLDAAFTDSRVWARLLDEAPEQYAV